MQKRVVGTFEPLGPDSPFIYFNKTHAFTNTGIQENKHDLVDDSVADTMEKYVPMDAHHPVTCQEMDEETVDPFGLSDESGSEGERTIKAEKEYLVRWKGYNDDERSWEPVQHLENAQEILLE
jgi:Chromo (CHRromatin Organisation MOdifier) domain